MKYVGNTALSPQIQERIQNTFSQTLSLAEEGNRQEALLGCDFILRLDPLFEPARRLQERLNAGGEGPVAVDGLMDAAPAAPEATPQAETAAAEPEIAVAPLETPSAVAVEPPLEVVEPVEEASVDIAELIADAPTDDMPLTGEAAVEVTPGVPEPDTELESASLQDESPPAEPPAVAVDVAARIAMLYEQREFRELMSLATEHQDRVADDPELRQMVSAAGERLEAEPYVRNFLDSARNSKETDDIEAARSYLEKAKELDASHPDIARLEADLGAASRVEPPAAFEPQPLVETPPLVEEETGAAGASNLDAALDVALEAPEEPAPPPPATPDPAEQAVPPLTTEPAARLDSESEQRIDELLKEGQQSFEEGQYQTAIDAWSRIFLIDIDHAEASRRIELARKLKAEVERQIEEAFHEGISLLESGDEEKAREAFDKVLEMHPAHLGARDYLDKLDSGTLRASAPEPGLAPPLEDSPAAEVEAFEASETLDMAAAPGGFEDMAPDFVAAEVDAVARPAPRKRSFLLIGSAVLILVLAAGWFMWSNWDRFFPGSVPETETAGAPSQVDPIEKALELHEAGNTPMAINVLRRLNPGHEQYAEALALIAMWEAGEAPVEPVTAAPSEEQLALRSELINQAERAVARGENLLALDLLGEAGSVGELTDEESVLEGQANDALEALRDERDLFNQGDWEYALPNLWRMHDADPENQDVLRLMVDSYYNLGLRDLQRGDAKSALEKFEEAQNLADDDDSLNRLAEFAEAYTKRPSDMLFRIFVKYHKFR